MFDKERGGGREKRKNKQSASLSPESSVPTRPRPQMSSPALRRLALLRSHLLPEGPASLTEERVPPPSPAATVAVSTLTCAGGRAPAGGDGDGGREDCVFCRIIRCKAPAYKVRIELCSPWFLDSWQIGGVVSVSLAVLLRAG